MPSWILIHHGYKSKELHTRDRGVLFEKRKQASVLFPKELQNSTMCFKRHIFLKKIDTIPNISQIIVTEV